MPYHTPYVVTNSVQQSLSIAARSYTTVTVTWYDKATKELFQNQSNRPNAQSLKQESTHAKRICSHVASQSTSERSFFSISKAAKTEPDFHNEEKSDASPTQHMLVHRNCFQLLDNSTIQRFHCKVIIEEGNIKSIRKREHRHRLSKTHKLCQNPNLNELKRKSREYTEI
jgi:hypothetical protein